MIAAVTITTYLPLMIILYTAAFVLNNSTDQEFLKKNANDFMWALLPCQINAILNSLIYSSKNSGMRHYFYNLFTIRNHEID